MGNSYDHTVIGHYELSLILYAGDVAYSTTVNSGGYLDVRSGGTANRTTVNSGGG